MQLSFKFNVEAGRTFMTMKVDAEVRALLDKQCELLGLAQATTARPLGFDSVGVSFWRDGRSQQLRRAIERRVQSAMRTEGMSYTDDVNAALYNDESGVAIINVGALRLRPEADVPLKLPVADYVLPPEAMSKTVKALTEGCRAIASIVFETEVTITITKEVPALARRTRGRAE